jgi:hypothetical protein
VNLFVLVVAVAADAPQRLLAQLAAAHPATYYGVLDSSLRKEVDSGKLLQAAQLVRQGLGFYSSSSTSSGFGGLAGVQNPSLTAQLLQDPAAVTALAFAVACLTKSWVGAFRMTHQQGKSSSSSSSRGITAGSPEEFDFCVAATKRMLQLGLVSVLDWLLQLQCPEQQQQQQQQQPESCEDATAEYNKDGGGSSSSRQAAASSLFLLLVVARSALLIQLTLQTATQQQQQVVIEPAASGSNKASAEPLTVLQESSAVLQDVYCKCMQLLDWLKSSTAAAPPGALIEAATAAAAAAESSTVQPVVWESLLQLHSWLQQSSSSSSNQATSSSTAAAAAATAASDTGSVSAAEEACRQLVGALPVPELCNNLSCSNLGGISEAAAAKKRCSGCKIGRWAERLTGCRATARCVVSSRARMDVWLLPGCENVKCGSKLMLVL